MKAVTKNVTSSSPTSQYRAPMNASNAPPVIRSP